MNSPDEALPLGRMDMPIDEISSLQKSLSLDPYRLPEALSGIIFQSFTFALWFTLRCHTPEVSHFVTVFVVKKKKKILFK